MLGLERTASEELRRGTAQLSTSLQQASQARDAALANADEAVATAEKLGHQLTEEQSKRATSAAQSTTDLDTLSQQIATLKDELQRLGTALGAAEIRDQENQETVRDLGQRLNRALAVKVLELARYRSEFFGRLKSVLGDRPGIAIEGDRFILQSEVLFPSGSAELAPEGAARLAPIAATLLEIAPEIPTDVKWILRVDGHTDQVPIRTGDFPSNWELSAARALSVVYYLIKQGVPAERLSAAGFGEFHPRDARRDEIGNRRNRRIELKLTRR